MTLGKSKLGYTVSRLIVVMTGTIACSAVPAWAGHVEVVDGTAVLTAQGGETNVIRAGTRQIRDGLTLRIDDDGAPLTGGPGCQQLSASSVWCPETQPGALALDVSTGAGDDRVTIDDSQFRIVSVHGGPGADTLHVGNSVGTPALIDGGGGDDTLSAAMNFSDRPILIGGAGDDVLTIFEGNGGQELGGNGDDRIVYSGTFIRNAPRLDGGDGNDTYTLPDFFNAAALVAGHGVDTLDQSAVSRALNFDMAGCPDCVERIIGTARDDQITGDANRQTIFGGAGADTLDGGGGRDVVSGEAGDDTLAGRDGFTDDLRCGDGLDAVTADRRDLVDADCETVVR